MNDKESNKILIYAVGDIMLGDHPHYLGIGIGSRLRGGKLRGPFEQVKHLLSGGDIVLGNLETVLSKSTNRYGLNRINMRGEPSWAQLLKEAGFNVISVANNHAMQHGITAWNESVKNLRDAGISVVGVKKEPTLFLECRGKRIAILGFSLRPPQYGFPSPPYCLASAQEVREKTRQAKEKADIVILSLHWGEEYSSWPSPEQARVGESFIRSGATLIVGHHPHVLQGVERKENSIIAYSLGNFVSDMVMRRSRETAILSLCLNGERIDELKLIPALIGEDSCPKVLESEEGNSLLKLIEKYALLISLSKKADAQTAYLKEIKKSIKEFRYEFMIWFIHNWRKYPSIALFSVLGGITIRKLLLPIKRLNKEPPERKPNKKIKILHIITRMIKGGAQRSTLLLVEGLRNNPYDYDVVLCSGPTYGPEGELVSDVKKKQIPFVILNDLVRNPNIVQDCKALVELYNLMKKTSFDIVHTHTSKAGFLGRIAAKLAGVPIIVHSPHGHIFHSYFSYPHTLLYILLEKFCGLFTDRIITLTTNDKLEHIKFHIAAEDKFAVIHNGVELEKFTKLNTDISKKKNELHIPENCYIVATVGRLVPEKGHQYLIEAAKKIQLEKKADIIFLIIGAGPLANRLKAMVRRLGLESHVRFLGMREDLPEILHIIDLFVLPSLNEGMGRALIEAMACSKAVVASNVGGIPNVVLDNITGVLVPPKDVNKLSEAILDLLKNKDKASKMGLEGKKSAFSFFDVKTMVKKTDGLYKELIELKNKKGG